MKKLMTFILLAVICVFMVSCDEKEKYQEQTKTTIPQKDVAISNLKDKGYNVEEDPEGEYITAEKGNDVIKVYWCKDEERCNEVYKTFEENKHEYETYIRVVDDEQGEYVVLCGSNKAVKDAGVKKVKVKATPHKDRLTALHTICLHIFRYITQILLDLRQQAFVKFRQSDEKSERVLTRCAYLCAIFVRCCLKVKINEKVKTGVKVKI